MPTINTNSTTGNESKFDSPHRLRKLVDRLMYAREEKQKRKLQVKKELERIEAYLGISDSVTQALDTLSRELFQEVLSMLENKLTIALQEVLEQPIHFKAEADFKHGSAVVEFSIERNGFEEDINKGQGGSVQNVLSVCLRMFALAMLDTEQVHRKFLVLDEQDCWLRPELVPKLVNIVHRAATELGFQVLMISHHDIELFSRFADKIYRFEPGPHAVRVKEVCPSPVDTYHEEPHD